VTRTGLNAETLGRQQDHTKGACSALQPCLGRLRVWSAAKFKSYLNESEIMTTYLTLVGMLLLVVSPLLIPLTVTVIPFCSNRFGRIAKWRKSTTLPRTVPVFSDRLGVHAAPSPA
jgi:hypothetical protein